ncbi:hypothetical protein [Nonomuraea sp. NPDC003804]|uniref:hypothetical protein n=1 Tax=Nonomuraea sp. NPDC003804 TaxID=3154547 RepID=UPI0033B30184
MRVPGFSRITLDLNQGQAEEFAQSIQKAYPDWLIERSGGIWCATGACWEPGCSCTRTIHHHSPLGLVVLLASANGEVT